MNTAIERPQAGEYPDYGGYYIQQVAENEDALSCMEANQSILENLVGGLDESQLRYRYEPGKWTIKEMVVHMIDAERVFGYRALVAARNDKSPMPGYDHNAYVPASEANERSIENILEEYQAVRAASLALFRNLPAEGLSRLGEASESPVTARALAYMIAGHERHHVRLMRERYL